MHVDPELLAKGLYAFRHGFDNGFHHLTTSTKPIRTVEDLVEKHTRAATLAQRQDIERLNTSALGALRDKGMIVNEADTSGFRKPLGASYARWKDVYGENAWALLEARVGRLV